MKKILVTIILMLSFFSGKAQSLIDSLNLVKNKLENAANFDEKQYSETVNSLIFCYMNISDYYNAKLAAEEGIKTLKNKGIKNDQALRTLYCYSGLIEYNLKNYVEALKIFEKTVNMCQEADDVGDDFIIAMCNAANVCGDLQQYANMKQIMDAAVEIYEQHHGSIFKITDERHFILVNNYGVANYNVGNNDLAEKCFRYVIDNCKGSFESNNALPLAIINYSTALIRAGSLSQAANLLKKARTLNTDYAYMMAQNLVLANFGKWKIKQTAEALSMFNDIAIDNVAKIFADFPSSQRENYWNKISMEMIALNNFVAYFHQNKEVLKQSFNMSLFCRNMLLNSEKMLEKCVRNSADLTLQNEFDELKTIKKQFIFNTAHDNNSDVLKSQIETKEAKIIHNLPDLRQQLQSSKSWEDVKNSLDDGEYAVEYSLMYSPKDDGGTDTIYCMLVIGKNFSEPKIEFSTSIRDCDKMFFNHNADTAFYNFIYRVQPKTLYTIFFKPIEQYLSNARTIYYSPCGKLSMLNFDLFTDETGTPLNEKYKMVRVSSTAEIQAVKNRNIIVSHSAALFGNIDYGTSVDDMRTAENAVATRGKVFVHLDNSKIEINNISQTLKNKNIDVKLYESTTANEKVFKNFSGQSPEILHLATHGFFLDTDEERTEKPFSQNINSYSEKESSMVFSGLALSGANNAWEGDFNVPDIEDGVLTAYEISQLDLSNTKLAVLSACETAKGKIFPVDGVFGLQRAFKQAGAGTILMSLWKVDDNATALFMSEFYKFLFSTGDRHKALKLAQDEVKKQRPEPNYWAAWIILD